MTRAIGNMRRWKGREYNIFPDENGVLFIGKIFDRNRRVEYQTRPDKARQVSYLCREAINYIVKGQFTGLVEHVDEGKELREAQDRTYKKIKIEMRRRKNG